MKTRTRLLSAAVAVFAVLTSAPAVQAFPDQAARVDQQIRPNFGGLITPPLKPRWRPDRWKPRSGGYRKPRPGRPGYPPPPYEPYESTISVDCNAPYQPAPYDAGPANGSQSDSQYDGGPSDSGAGYGDSQGSSYGPLSDALQRLADGGTVYVRGVCRETIWIERSVTIVGEAASVFSETTAQPATIAPPEGSACVKVAPGVQAVEIRDMVLTTDKGGRTACVEAWDAQLALVRTTVNYWGDSAAVFASGGKLILRESAIDARSWDAAVVAESALLDIQRTRIIGEETGIDVTPAQGESRIEQTGVMARNTSASAGSGILVRGLRSGSGLLTIRNAVVCGWRNGLHLDRGAQVDVSRSRFCRTTVGVVSDGELRFTESAIGSRDVGVYVAGGTATIHRNRIHDWSRRPIWVEYGASADVENNWVYYNGDCWRQDFGRGSYCVRQSSLPPSLRDDGFSSDRRNWWEHDGYDRGFARDGAPAALPPAAPPKPVKRGWGRSSPPPPAAAAPAPKDSAGPESQPPL